MSRERAAVRYVDALSEHQKATTILKEFEHRVASWSNMRYFRWGGIDLIMDDAAVETFRAQLTKQEINALQNLEHAKEELNK